jgi:RNA polymerase sigma-70 factor, ECF subfamily
VAAGGAFNPGAWLTTTELVGRVLAGDELAERELYDQHVERVYRLAFRLTGDPDLAADCTQETFIRVFDRLETFRGEAALSTWITSVAYSVVFNGLRKARRSSDREVALDERLERPSRPVADPDLKAGLTRAIDALPDGYRTVFVMHDVEGYTHGEIATALGIQEGTSKAQLSRARAKLRTALAAFAGE